MKRLIALIIVSITCYSALSQDTLQYLDTIVNKDLSKTPAHVISLSPETVEYKVQGDSVIHLSSLYLFDHVIVRDGSIVKFTLPNEPTDDIKSIAIRKPLPDKRIGDILISTNFLGMLRSNPYSNGTANIGASYYITSNLSIGAHLYRDLLFRSRPDFYYTPLFKQGFELSAGFISSTTKKFDYGVRVGFIYTEIAHLEETNTTTVIYTEDDLNGSTGTVFHNGKDYYYYQTFYETEQKTLNDMSFDPYISFEGNISLPKRLSLFFNVGFKYANNRSYYYGAGYKNVDIYRYLSSDWQVDDEVMTEYTNDFYTRGRRTYMFLRFGVNFHIKTNE